MRAAALTIFISLLWAAPCHGAATAKEPVRVSCDSPIFARIMSSPWRGSASQDAWVVILFDRMQVGGASCDFPRGDLDVFMHRQASNDLIGATLPTPTQVHEALAAESRLENWPSMSAREFHNLLHTRSFGLELVRDGAPPATPVKRPKDAVQRPSGMWSAAGQPGGPFWIEVGFTNTTNRPAWWSKTALVLRDPETGYLVADMPCDAPREARRVQPGERVVAACHGTASPMESRIEGALAHIHDRAQWTLRDEGWASHRFYADVASPAAYERAEQMLASSCGDRGSCGQEEWARGGPPGLFSQMWPVWLIGMPIGAGLYLLLRPSARRSPGVLLGIIVVVIAIAVAVATLGSGLGGLAILAIVVVGGVGVIAGTALAFALRGSKRD